MHQYMNPPVLERMTPTRFNGEVDLRRQGHRRANAIILDHSFSVRQQRPMTNTKHYLYPVIGLYEPNPNHSAKVAPKEFLSWAENDLKSYDKRARRNALSNIKKALHARLDEIISWTHIRFSSDWDPPYVTTDQKLNVIRQLGIKHEAIVALITAIRNDYEHGYIVPPLNVVKAYLGTCELWLEKTYDIYDFHSVAFANLPMTGITSGARKGNGSVVSKAEFYEPTKVTFFLHFLKKTIN
ncbi:MAG: hypothetical protein ACYC0X_04785 [Pirellulaceae bacterium]